MLSLEKKKQKAEQPARSGLQQQIQMGCHVRQVDALQEKNGGSSSTTAMPQVASMMPSHVRRSSQMQSQPTVMGKSAQILDSHPSSVNPLDQGVQLSQQEMVQTAAAQNQKHSMAMQMQDSNFMPNSSSTAQAQEQSVVQSNGQHNHLPMQSARGTSMLLQEQMIMNHQGLGLNQQQMDMQKYHFATKMHNGPPEGGNSQHNSGLTVSRMEPQKVMMKSAGEVDWREEMFQKVRILPF